MAECSKLSKTITDIAMNIGSREDVKTLDDVIARMQSLFPDVRREHIVDAIVEATTRESKTTDDLVAKLNDIKREAKLEKSTQDKIDELTKYLQEGTLPQKQAHEITTNDALERLRGIRNDLQRQLSQSEPAVKERLQKSISALEERIKSGDIMPKPKTAVKYDTPELRQLAYQRDMLARDIRSRIYEMKPTNIWQKTGKGIDLVRLFMTTGEFSFALRQGGTYAYTHPIKWAKGLADAFGSFASEQTTYEINKEIANRELAPVAFKAKLPMLYEGMSLSSTEEAIMNSWADKLPIVKNFTRAGMTFFNKIRADWFDMGYRTLGKTRTMTEGEAEVWANFISVFTGRGKMGALEPATLALNRGLFAARYVMSRFQLLLGQPLWHGITMAELKAGYKQITGQALTTEETQATALRARYLIAKEYGRLFVGLSVIYALGALLGADEEKDPRSSDFGKLRFGRSRLDPLMGLAQPITLMSRIISGKTKTQGGEIRSLRGEDKKYGAADVQDVMSNFLRSKLSPSFGFLMNLATGETYSGQEMTLLNSVASLGYPITYGDIYQVMQEDGIPKDVALSIMTIFGMGLQTYGQFDRYDDKQLAEKISKSTNKSGSPHKGQESNVKAMKEELLRRKLKNY